MKDSRIKASTWRSKSSVTLWNVYFINGHKFHTKLWSDEKNPCIVGSM